MATTGNKKNSLRDKKWTDLGVELSIPVAKTLKELKFLTATPVQVSTLKTVWPLVDAANVLMN